MNSSVCEICENKINGDYIKINGMNICGNCLCNNLKKVNILEKQIEKLKKEIAELAIKRH